MRKGRIVRITAFLFCAAALAGCTNDPGFRGVIGVREARAEDVLACRYISDISMRPSLYGPVLGQQALKYARNTIMADALDSGANTVVFDQATPGSDVYKLHAKAYSC
ncbi:hypothetical protein [Defluviimonas sp. WL0075]|uniref:Lipoprotein n=1 Tax=Albidovulum sediminicola TaxID=2984331 RepID=A0ABT2YY56_9RHOB|nr:hypothetical protein [Defluviimonas sp. WL0075]MCV2863813.1 hypothetical protein [Defluviimonas sp. WL0075]